MSPRIPKPYCSVLRMYFLQSAVMMQRLILQNLACKYYQIEFPLELSQDNSHKNMQKQCVTKASMLIISAMRSNIECQCRKRNERYKVIVQIMRGVRIIPESHYPGSTVLGPGIRNDSRHHILIL